MEPAPLDPRAEPQPEHRVEPEQVERLLTRVDALETEIARLRKTRPTRSDRDPEG
jgi:hypothetical protein